MSEEPLMSMRSPEREMNHRAERLMQALKRIAELEAERDQLKLSVLNQAGDNRCWFDPKTAALPPKPQFIESCNRFYDQASASDGVLQGCRTIAQLEAENARLRQALEDAPHARTCDSWEDDMPCDCWKAALARPPEAK